MKVNLRWPENKAKGIVPWFVILRRCIFWIPFVIAICIGWLCVLGMFGFWDAKRFWNNSL